MDFSYYDDNKIKHYIELKAGQKWNDLKIESKYVNTIFDLCDNDDGIISQEEIEIIRSQSDVFTTANDLMKAFSQSEKLNSSLYLKHESPADILSKINSDNLLTIQYYYGEESYSYNSYLVTDILNSNDLSKTEKINFLNKLKQDIIKYCEDNFIYSDDIVKNFDNELDVIKTVPEKLLNNSYFDTLLRRLYDRGPNLYLNETPAERIDGKINKTIQQGNTGDCWLIAVIIALKEIDKNQPEDKKFLDKMVKPNDDKTLFYVTLPGVNKRYTITADDINGCTELSEGEEEIRAIEIACNKYFYEQRGVNDSLDINGNTTDVAINILLGNTDTLTQNQITPYHAKEASNDKSSYLPSSIRSTVLFNQNSEKKGKESLEKRLKELNDPQSIRIASRTDNEDYSFTNSEGQEIELYSDHAYTIKKVDNENAYIINPWDSSETVVVPLNIFLKYFDNIEVKKVPSLFV